MAVVLRAITFASLFIGLVLFLVPAQVLSRSGFTPPASIGVPEIAAMVVAICGAALGLWCIGSFALIGRGTPAPFDPPRRLVVRGPYAVVRNPMYIGAGLALVGAALFLRSPALLAYAGVLLLAAHLFVVLYEEPTLRRTFGAEYEAYCRRIGRWWPRVERTDKRGSEPR